MPVDPSFVRLNYVLKAQAVAKKVIELQSALDQLAALFAGASLTGTFVDAELWASNPTKHLDATFVGTATANLGTVRTAMSATILNNLSKLVGDVPIT